MVRFSKTFIVTGKTLEKRNIAANTLKEVKCDTKNRPLSYTFCPEMAKKCPACGELVKYQSVTQA